MITLNVITGSGFLGEIKATLEGLAVVVWLGFRATEGKEIFRDTSSDEGYRS